MVSLDQTEKKCPFCAELIKKEAIVCRYCSRDLPPDTVNHLIIEKATCRECSTKMLPSTAARYNGLCAMCAKKKGYSRQKSSPAVSTAPSCAKCGSTVITYNKKGFSGGKALIGAVAFAGVGLLAGLIGSNKIRATCVKCGNSWYVS